MARMHDMSALESLASEIDNLNLATLSYNTALHCLIRFSIGFAVPGAVYRNENIWWRARNCEPLNWMPGNAFRRFENVSELLYRRDGNPSLGRCNLPGQKVLYGASNIRTALLEINAKVGDIIQLTSIRPVCNIPLHFAHIGRYRDYDANGMALRRSDEDLRREKMFHEKQYRQSLFIDRFLSKLFSHSGPEKYILTAALSSYYLAAKRNGAIIYPSVKNNVGINIAIPGEAFDRMFEVLETHVVEVESISNYEPVFTRQIFRADQFSQDGVPLWNSPKSRIYSGSFGHESPSMPGWRYGGSD